RQEDAGKFFDDNGSLNKNQGIVAITRSGITVASGNEINDNIIDGIQYVFESELPQEVKISVKLVESALNIRIASSYDGTVLHNGNYTVNYNRAGYLAFGVSASEHYFADISLTHLNSDGSTIGLNLSDLVTGDMQSLYEENKLLPIGHADVVNNALQMDWTNSGFEISGNMLGALKLKTVRTDNDSFVNVIIDGAEPVKISVPVGTNTITVADNLAEGVHTVRVLSGTSPAFGTLTVKDIIYSGELNRSEIDNSKIRMMAIGDSITAGFGINGSNGDPLDFANKIATSDGYYSYAAIAARTLGAEIDTVAKEAAPISEVHGLVNKLNMRAGSPEWNWGKNQKDIIVINLGTNDEWIPGKTAQTALEDAKALLDDMRAKNPDAYIIWVYGMMRKDYEASYKAAVEYMNAKGDARVFSLEMQPNNDALEGHPSATAHVEYANQLVTFIRQNCSEIINISTQTKTIKELNNQGVIAFNGRSKWAGDAVSSVYGSAGFTVSGYIYGDFILNCFHTTENIVRLDIILDGDSDNMQTIELPAGFSGDVTLIGNLTRGEHTVQVRRASSDWGTTTYNSITYTGKLEKPETKSLRMEFIGDSLTVGEGAYGSFDDSDVKNYVRYQNSMTGYAAQTARLLEADFSMLAHCGVTTQGMIEDYNNANSDYVNDAGKKDIVVINLGTNDVGWQSESVVTEEYLSNLKTSVSNLINAVINKNGKDVCIVWCYGMMSDNYLANLREMVNETAPEGSNVFFCDLSAAKDTGGYRGHPLLAGHTASATILSEFIKNNCMRIVANGDVNLDTVTDIRDLVRYKKYFSGIEVPFAKQKADVNLDKVLDSADIVKLRKLLLGIE
ncbi:MAG: GDSL-type esterase/lipase family protein, partial [Acutalibacteraceae bacterium]